MSILTAIRERWRESKRKLVESEPDIDAALEKLQKRDNTMMVVVGTGAVILFALFLIWLLT